MRHVVVPAHVLEQAAAIEERHGGVAAFVPVATASTRPAANRAAWAARKSARPGARSRRSVPRWAAGAAGANLWAPREARRRRTAAAEDMTMV